MLETPLILQVDAQVTACVRLTISRAEIQAAMGLAINEVLAELASQGIRPAGPLYSSHLRMDPEFFDMEVGFPVTDPATEAGRLHPGELPAGRVARVVYRGPYEGLGAAWHAFGSWIKEHGHRPAANLWESYVAGPESGPDPAAWRTELTRPLQD
jgi:effector-binding domain-containing protein